MLSTSVCLSPPPPDSTWPSDHGDCSRSKYTLGAGLPANVTSEDIKRIDNVDVGNAQW